VLRDHPELAVVAPELLQERHQVVGLVDHLDDVDQRPQQAAALHLHVDREQVARLRRPTEQRGVEVPAECLGMRFDQREAGADDLHRPGRLGPGPTDRGEIGGEELLGGHRWTGSSARRHPGRGPGERWC
jgi:hypothetical protein